MSAMEMNELQVAEASIGKILLQLKKMDFEGKEPSLACSFYTYSTTMPFLYPEDLGPLAEGQLSCLEGDVAMTGNRPRSLHEDDFLNQSNVTQNCSNLYADLNADFSVTYQTMSQLEWHDVEVSEMNDIPESADLGSETDAGFPYLHEELSPSSAEELTDDVSVDSSDFGSEGDGGHEYMLDRCLHAYSDDQSDSDPRLDQCHPMHTVLATSSQILCHEERKKPGRKKGQTSNVLHLWEFIRDLLVDPATCESLIRWENKREGIFRLVNTSDVATLWGKKKKNKKPMTYEKMSRSLRYSRKEGYFADLPKHRGYPKKLCFQFGPKAHGWK